MATMGLTLPTTRDAWRALIDTALGQGNTATAAKLISLSGAFASVTQSTSDLAAAAESAAQRISAERAGLQKQWLQATGDTAALRRLELQSLDASNQALQLQIWAYEDQAAAAKVAAQAQAEYNSQLADAQAFISGVATTITQWIDGINATAGTPTQNLAATQAAFQRQLALAKTGDRDALGSITGYACLLYTSPSPRDS